MNDLTLIQLSKKELFELIKEAIREEKSLNVIADAPPSTNELLKIDEVAKMFNCSKQSIFNWKKAGKLPSYRIATRVYYKRDEVLNCLNKAN